MKQSLEFGYHHVPLTPKISEHIAAYTEQLRVISSMKSGPYESHEHSLRLPFDPSVVSEVTHLVQRYWNTQLKYVIVVGIGGSNLGAKAVYDALRGGPSEPINTSPKLLFADTISPRLLEDIVHLLEHNVSYVEEFVVLLISKSGGTTESIANFALLYQALTERFSDASSRVIVTTDHGSPLWNRAEKEGFGLIAIPKMVGGRFSVFSSVGLLPLALVGIDVNDLILGGKDIATQCFSGDNASLRLAEAIYRSMKHGASIINLFFFNPEFESLGKWTRQLYAESLGKESNRSGKIVHAGITPIVSIGSTDLHSMVQLYLGGPRDKFTLFLHVPDRDRRQVPKNGLFTDLIPVLRGKSPGAIISAIYEGVKTAYGTHRLPYGEAILPSVTPYTLGMYLEWQMITVMYLGELLHVNTFDQPNVEDYKKVTKTILEQDRTSL